MTSGQVLDIFRATGALLEGHFLYTSGRHGAHFVQASACSVSNYTERLCKAIAEKWADEKSSWSSARYGRHILSTKPRAT